MMFSFILFETEDGGKIGFKKNGLHPERPFFVPASLCYPPIFYRHSALLCSFSCIDMQTFVDDIETK